MKVLNAFLNLDIYGIIPSFTIHGHKRFRTIIGSLLSLITYLIIILFFGVYLKGVLKHTSPNLVTTIYNDFDPKPINLTKDNFIITLSLQTIDYSNYLDESIYYVNATLSSTILLKDGIYEETITPLNLIKCSEYNFHFLNEYWNNLPLNDLYCLDINNIILRGNFKNAIWNVLYLKFSKCINSTENNNSCKSNEIIDEYLKGGYLGIFLSDIIIEPNNFENPSQLFGKNIFTTFTYKEYSDYWIYLKTEQVVTDTGYFFEKKNTKYFFAVDNVEHLSDYREDNNIFLSVGIRKSLKREVYERSYIKLQEAAGNACGIIRVAILTGEIIAYFFQKLLYNTFIIQFINFTNVSHQYFKNMNNSNQLLKNLYINLDKNLQKDNKTVIYSPFLNKKKKNQKLSVNMSNGNNSVSTHNKNNNGSFHNNHSYTLKSHFKKYFKAEKKICFSIIICNKNCVNKVKHIFNKYSKIEYCFDIIQYLKLHYEISLVKLFIFDEDKNQKIKDLYFLNYEEFSEKESYDKVFKYNNIT